MSAEDAYVKSLQVLRIPMAYFTPLQRNDGRWDYTCTNGAGTFPLGYCSGYRELLDSGVIKGMFTQAMLDRENARTAPFQEKYHTTGHATAAEATNCYRQHQLDQHLEFDDGVTRRPRSAAEFARSGPPAWAISPAKASGTGLFARSIATANPSSDCGRKRSEPALPVHSFGD